MSHERPGSRWSAPPTRWTGPPAALSTCPTPRSCSASSTPPDVLAGLVDGPVMVDNDVNWAARAERDADSPRLDDFAYLHLGEGLGCAVVSDGEVRRGHAGLAGEIAHVLTDGPDGRAVPLIDVFGALGLRRPGIDGDRRARTAGGGRTRRCASTRSAGNPGPGDLRRPRRRGRLLRPRNRRHRRDVGHCARLSTPSPRSSSDSPATSRSEPRNSPTHPLSPAPGAMHSTSFRRPSQPPPDRLEPQRPRQRPSRSTHLDDHFLITGRTRCSTSPADHWTGSRSQILIEARSMVPRNV